RALLQGLMNADGWGPSTEQSRRHVQGETGIAHPMPRYCQAGCEAESALPGCVVRALAPSVVHTHADCIRRSQFAAVCSHPRFADCTLSLQSASMFAEPRSMFIGVAVAVDVRRAAVDSWRGCDRCSQGRSRCLARLRSMFAEAQAEGRGGCVARLRGRVGGLQAMLWWVAVDGGRVGVDGVRGCGGGMV